MSLEGQSGTHRETLPQKQTNKQANPQKPVGLKGRAWQIKPKQTLLDLQSLLEVIQSPTAPISLWILVGSILGGLLLLALLVFCLWKVSPAFVGGGSIVPTV